MIFCKKVYNNNEKIYKKVGDFMNKKLIGTLLYSIPASLFMLFLIVVAIMIAY